MQPAQQTLKWYNGNCCMKCYFGVMTFKEVYIVHTASLVIHKNNKTSGENKKGTSNYIF